jgi:hypothetical protein
VPRTGILLVGLLLALAPAAQAQVIADEFSDSYSFRDLGPPPESRRTSEA